MVFTTHLLGLPHYKLQLFICFTKHLGGCIGHILAFLVLCKLYTNTWLLLMDIYQLNLDLLQEHKHEPSPRMWLSIDFP